MLSSHGYEPWEKSSVNTETQLTLKTERFSFTTCYQSTVAVEITNNLVVICVFHFIYEILKLFFS